MTFGFLGGPYSINEVCQNLRWWEYVWSDHAKCRIAPNHWISWNIWIFSISLYRNSPQISALLWAFLVASQIGSMHSTFTFAECKFPGKPDDDDNDDDNPPPQFMAWMTEMLMVQKQESNHQGKFRRWSLLTYMSCRAYVRDLDLISGFK